MSIDTQTLRATLLEYHKQEGLDYPDALACTNSDMQYIDTKLKTTKLLPKYQADESAKALL